jgi:hypothetical protein
LAAALYRVDSRTCHGNQVEETTCGRIRYIEIVRGKFGGIRDGELAIVQWSAVDANSGPFTYSARPLRGFKHGERYIIDEVSLPTRETREWFLIRAGQPVAYRLDRRVEGAAEHDAATFELALAPVVRDAAVAAQLQYPPPVPEE